MQELVEDSGYEAAVTTQFGFESFAAPQGIFKIK